MTVLSKSEYIQYLSEVNDPELSQVWGIIAACMEAQEKKLTLVDFTVSGNSPQIVPLKVVTYLTGNYQWSFEMTNLPNQMRRITKITLV
jgi:hypothetical protein